MTAFPGCPDGLLRHSGPQKLPFYMSARHGEGGMAAAGAKLQEAAGKNWEKLKKCPRKPAFSRFIFHIPVIDKICMPPYNRL